ncbi:conserved uncharacterized protein, DUF400 [Desulfosarcina variabilis str. Montpellier]|uniref:hypothetical protein n=1 Tax=Desulfosarcina variabilis TaxID=2300 RepID=UPI003AFA9A2B
MMKGITVVGLCIGFLINVAWAQDNWQSVTDSESVFQQGYAQVISSSEEGQSRYRATRAAQVVAQRDLLEALQGLTLTGSTSVADGMLESDQIKTSVEGFLKGAIKCGEKYYPEQRYAEVCMRINIRGRGGMYENMLPLFMQDRMVKDKKPDYQPAQEAVPANDSGDLGKQEEAKAEDTTSNDIADPYDGLIVDARGFQFRPAMVNRILTEKEQVIFDPSKILGNILVERGCGGFTNDNDKAKVMLENWGSKNPMLVKCTDVDQFTDAKISLDDAEILYKHNLKSNLFAQARVVFMVQ